jgi:DNA repair exonuclease SbcCD nuclease subunit
MFNGCDCVMAGHIHKFQTLYLGETPIVYSSSVFQQNTGENVSGHGFVLWDMEVLSYKLIEVKNDYAIYHFKIKDYEDVKNDKEILTNQ